MTKKKQFTQGGGTTLFWQGCEEAPVIHHYNQMITLHTPLSAQRQLYHSQQQKETTKKGILLMPNNGKSFMA